MTDNGPVLVYPYRGNLYVNLTNECPTACAFCVKHKWKMDFRGYNLSLKGDYSAQDFARAIGKSFKTSGFGEIVFCGYGEPTVRLELMLEICRAVRDSKIEGVRPDITIRLNTNGMANIIHDRNIVPMLDDLVDSAHISLNTADGEQWLEMMNPLPRYRENAFLAVLDFINECAKTLKETCITAIDNPGVNIEKLKNLAKRLNTGFRLRKRL